MQNVLRGCERVMLYISTLSTFVLMLLTTADAGGRYIFNRPITGAYEVSTNYLMIAAIFMALSFGYRQGSYIRVTLLTSHLRGRVKLVVNTSFRWSPCCMGSCSSSPPTNRPCAPLRCIRR